MALSWLLLSCMWVTHTIPSCVTQSAVPHARQHLLHKNNIQLLALKWRLHHMPVSHLVSARGAGAWPPLVKVVKESGAGMWRRLQLSFCFGSNRSLSGLWLDAFSLFVQPYIIDECQSASDQGCLAQSLLKNHHQDKSFHANFVQCILTPKTISRNYF